VTHDQEEAFEVADRVVVMNHGKVEQEGTPQEVFDHPANPFVMDFLGNVNVFHGRAQDGKVLLGNMEMAYPQYPHAESRDVVGYVRPHELDINRTPNGKSGFPAKIMQINPAGSVAKVRVASDEFGIALNVDLTLERYSELQLAAGETVYIVPRRVRVFLPDDYVI
jgi:sulfate transport system ATP-binding protein